MPLNKSKIVVTKNGPYQVYGNLPLGKEISVTGKDNIPEKWVKGEDIRHPQEYRLCRCGKSKAKPFCDGTHLKWNFDGAETASNEPYLDRARKIEGPVLDLTDVRPLCSSARFCEKGMGTWTATKNSDNPEAKKLAIETACNCPSGRLIAWDKETGEPIEPELSPEITVTQDTGMGVSGPLRVKGGIEIESEDKGTKYEVRNRVTLCRCGKSKNKPFCDGAHIHAKFDDKN